MSEFKGTPAPWTGKDINICSQDRAGLQIAFLTTDNVDRRAEGLANAHLISASPELLEACLRSRNQLYAAGYDSKEVSLNPTEELLFQLESAIKKALSK
ncbi:hypothetical protein ACP3TB_21575 (plasmid) [Rahnella variigena]|uniref:hypothetical protein n=1 Tax=Rahnella variigena TaxID=574964 RepID=UPI003CE68EA0